MERITQHTSRVCSKTITRTATIVLTTGLTAGSLWLATPAADAGQRPDAAPVATAAVCHRTLPAYPVVHPGDHGAAVSALQCLLNDSGLGLVIIDGWYGPQTKAAVLKVARGTEGPVDTSGRVDPTVWTSIISRALSGRVLRTGSSGRDVVTLQRSLRAQGCTISVDGSFGGQTAAVVKRFQRATGNVPDGIVGEATRFALQSGGAAGWHCP